MDLEGLKDSIRTNPLDPRPVNQALKEILADLESEDAIPQLEQILDVLFDENEDLDGLRRTLDARIRSLTGETTEEHIVLMEVATRYWHKLGAPDRAESYFRKLKTIPGYEDTVREFYIEFYLSRNNWRRVEEQMLESAGASRESEEALEVFEQLAKLARKKRETTREAQYLEKLMKAGRFDETILNRLIELNRQAGRWHVVANLLNRQASTEEDLDRLREIYPELIRIYSEEMNVEAKSLGVYEAWRKQDPENTHLVEDLLDLLQRLRRWPNYVRLLREQADREPKAKARKKLLVAVADAYMEHLRNTPEAIKALEEARELAPTDRRIGNRLKDLYQERRDFQSYIDLVREDLAQVEDPEERFQQMLQLAELAERELRRPAAILPLWESIYAEHPEDIRTQDALLQLYERGQEFTKLLALLEQRAKNSEDRVEKAQLLERIAVTAHTRLKDPARASEAWEQLLDVDADHVRAFAEVRKHHIAAQNWDSLGALFKARGMLDDFGRILESQSRKTESIEEKTGLLERLITLYGDEIGDNSRALRPMDQLLALQPDNVVALQRMADLARTANDSKRLIQSLNALAPMLDRSDERKEVYLELAELAEHRQMRPKDAFFHLVAALKEDPADLELMNRMSGVAERASEVDTMLDVLESVFPVVAPEPRVAIPVALQIARKAQTNDSGPERSIRFFGEVLSREDDHVESLEAMLEDAKRQSDSHGQISFMERLADVVEGSRSHRLRSEAAELQMEIGDYDGAEQTLKRAIDDAPEAIELRERLEGLYIDQERYDDAIEAVRNLISGMDAQLNPEARANAHVRLALGLLMAESNVEDAGTALLSALSYTPDHEEALQLLTQHLKDLVHRAPVLVALETGFRLREDHNSLVDILELQADRVEGDELGHRLEQLLTIYQSSLQDLERSCRTLGRLLRLRPSDADTRSQLEDAAEAAGLWFHVVSLYRELAPTVDAKTRRTLLLRIADIETSQLDDPYAAADALETLAVEHPEDTVVLKRLIGLYSAGSRNAELARTMRRLVPLVDESESLTMRLDLATLLSQTLQNPDEALTVLQEARGLWPESVELLSTTHELLKQLERPSDEEQILRDLAARSEGSERHEYLIQAGTLAFRALEDPHAALQRVREVLNEDAVHDGAISLGLTIFETASDVHDEAAPLLAPALRATHNAAALVPVLEVLEIGAPNPGDKAEIHIELAELYLGALAEKELAQVHLRTATSHTPNVIDLRNRGTHLARELDQMGDHVQFLEGLAGASDDTDLQITLLQEVATLLETDLNDPDGALLRHERILSEFDESNELSLDIVLLRHESNQAHDRFLHWIDHALNTQHVPDARSGLYYRAIDMARDGGQLTRALDYLQAAETEFPNDLDFRRMHVETARSTNDPEALTTALRSLANGTEDAEERGQARKEYAQILSGLEDREDDAIAELNLHLRDEPEDRTALELLATLHERVEAHEDLVSDLKRIRKLLSAEEQVQSTHLALRIAREISMALDRPDEACSWYSTLFESEPGHPDGIADLETLLVDDRSSDKAYSILDGVYTRLEQSADRVRIREIRADQLHVHEERAPLYRESAEMAYGELGDSRRSLTNYLKVLEHEPADEALRNQCHDLADESGCHDLLAATLAAGAEAASSPQLQCQLLKERASLHLGPLEDTGAGIQALKAALDAVHDDEEAQDRLDNIYQTEERHEDLAELLELRSHTATDTSAKQTFTLRRVDLLTGPLGNHDDAVMVLSGMLANSTSDEVVSRLRNLFDQGVCGDDIFPLLDRAYQEQERYGDVGDILKSRANQVEGEHERATIYQRLGTLCVEQLSDPEGAMESFAQAWRLDPTNPTNRDALRNAAAQATRLDYYADTLADVASATDDDVVRAEWMLEEAQIRRDALDQSEQAETVYRAIIQLAPDHLDAYHALDAMLEEGERYPEQAQILQRKAELLDGPQQIDTLHQLADLQAEVLGQAESARSTLLSILDAQPGDIQAHEKIQQVYRTMGDRDGLAQALRNHAEIASAPSVRVEKLTRAATIYAELEQIDEAIASYEEALLVQPENLGILKPLSELVRRQENHDRLAELLREELRILDEDKTDDRLSLHRELASLLSTHLDDAFGALKELDTAVALKSDAWDLWQSMRTIACAVGQADSEVRATEALLRSDGIEEEERASYLHALAGLKTEAVIDLPGAIDAWSQYLTLRASDRAGHEAYLELLEQSQEHSRLAGHLDTLWGMEDLGFDQESRLDMRLRQADLLAMNLNRADDAKAVLEELVETVPELEQAWLTVERLYREGGNTEELASVLVRRSTILDEPADTIPMLREAASLYSDQLEDHARALEVLLEAVGADAEDESLFHSALQEARQVGEFQGLLQVGAASAQALDVEARIERVALLAETSAKENNDVDWALQLFETTLSDVGPNVVLLEAYCEHLEDAGRWEELVQTLGQLGDSQEDVYIKIGVARRRATICEEKRSDMDGAIAVHEQIVDLDASDKDALVALERLYLHIGNYEKLVVTLERLIDVDPARQAELYKMMGNVQLEELDNVSKAAEAFEQASALNPSDLSCYRLLEAAFGGLEDWSSLGEVYERWALVENDPQARAEVCRNLGIVREAQSDSDGAIDAYNQALSAHAQDEDALAAVQRIHTEKGQHEELIYVYRGLVGRTDNVDQKVSLLERIAHLQQEELQAAEDAIQTYEEILGHQPDGIEPFTAWCRLNESIGDAGQAAIFLKRLMANTSEEGLRARVGFVLAEILHGDLENSADALAVLESTQSADDNTFAGLVLRSDIHEALGNEDQLEQVLTSLSNIATTDEQSAHAMFKLARFAEHKQDTDTARSLYESALEKEPEHTGVIRNLALLYLSQEKYVDAEPLLSVLVATLSERPDATAALSEAYGLLGATARHLLDPTSALDHYQKVIELDPSNSAARLIVGDLAHQQGQNSLAQSCVEAVLDEGIPLNLNDRKMAHQILGEIYLGNGDNDLAREHLLEVIALDPGNEQVISDMVELSTRYGDYEGALDDLRTLTGLKSSQLEKYNILLNMVEIAGEKLNDVDRVESLLVEAVQTYGEGRAARIELLKLYRSQERTSDAIRALESLAHIEDDTALKYGYIESAAKLAQDLGDQALAVDLLNQALDMDPHRLDAFALIDTILTESRDWTAQEQNYRRMLERVRGRDDMAGIAFKLFTGLGEIYRSRLGDLRYAADAFELALKTEPDHIPTLEILADLYGHLGDLKMVVSVLRRLARINPGHSSALRALFNTANKAGDLETVRVAAQILFILQDHDEQVLAYHDEHVPASMVAAKHRLDLGSWQQHLIPPGPTAVLGEVYAIVYRVLGGWLEAKDLKSVGLSEKDRVDAEGKEMLANVLRRVTDVLGLGEVQLYRRPNESGIALEPVVPPCISVGTDMLTGKSESELAYLLGKHLALLLPMHVLASIYGPSRLQGLLEVAKVCANPSHKPASGGDSILEAAEQMRQDITHTDEDRLRQLVEALGDHDEMKLIDYYLNDVEVAATRAGQLVGDNLSISKQVIQAGYGTTLGSLSAGERIRELVRWMLSDSQMEARRSIDAQTK